MNVRRLLAEAIVVVSSILLAFALDAWWSERELRMELVEDLRSVDTELAENIARARTQVIYLDRMVSAIDALVALLEASPASTVSVPDTLAGLANFPPTLEAPFGAVSALRSSGRFSEIRDPELRRRLASIEVWVEEVLEDQEIGRQIYVEQQGPLLDPHPQERTSWVTLSLLQSPEGALQSIKMMDYPNLPELRAVLYRKNAWYRVGLAQMMRLVDQLEQTRTVLRQELELDGA